MMKAEILELFFTRLLKAENLNLFFILLVNAKNLTFLFNYPGIENLERSKKKTYFSSLKRSHSSAAVLVTKGRGRATESAPNKNSDTKAVVALDDQNPSSTAWMPDPVTGYYGPASRQKEIDAAEMRGRHLSRK
ncbi:hypothetical protein IEQ34_003181 [Dendrobium chrysotoxum]|uniref:Late embryogenesis abundant protein n=1 Tax=Dendrobium chrysotoxum TaxID=161865 RepID=A0AAV7HJ94_DENCH|nr:hypothetical protein IEQ34_003181 [Dendrobium chrysotoxum]